MTAAERTERDVRVWSGAWAARALLSSVGSITRHRDRPWRALVTPEFVWLRGHGLTRVESNALRSVADLELFVELEGALYPLDFSATETPRPRRVPIGAPPVGEWGELADAFPLAPVGETAPITLERVPLVFVRSAAVQPLRLLRTRGDAFRTWALRAPRARLSPLRFLRLDTPEPDTVVVGDPLPPLPGRRFTLRSGLALPAGWALAIGDTPIPAEWLPSVATWLRCGRGDVVVFEPIEGGEVAEFTRWRGETFTPLTRSSIRASYGDESVGDATLGGEA